MKYYRQYLLGNNETEFTKNMNILIETDKESSRVGYNIVKQSKSTIFRMLCYNRI